MESQLEPTEILDRPGLPFEARRRALVELARSNRLLFGYRAVLKALIPWLCRGIARDRTLIDLGSGTGDVADRVGLATARHGVRLRVIAVDSQLSHLVIGRRQLPHQLRVVADARALPFRDATADWTFCHQLLHHFADEPAKSVLAEMRRVCRIGAAVVDLRGGWLTRLGVALLLPLIGVGAIGRHDGRLSARNAYSLSRLRALVSGIEILELRPRFPRRLSLLLPPLARAEGNDRQSRQ